MPISAFLEETGEDETSKNLKDATLRRRRSWDEALLKADTVLDVERIAERVTRLGDLVVLTRIHDGLHDLVLSAPEVRAEAYRQVAQWATAYLP